MKGKIFKSLNILGLAAVFTWLFWVHFNLVRYPWPLDPRESAMLQSTQVISQGQDPWALSRQPQSQNQYGGFYNVTVAPLARLAGSSSFWLHRGVSAVFIFATVGMLFFCLRKEGLSGLEAGWLSAIEYISLLFCVGPLARPDAEGNFLFLACILLPIHRREKSWAWYLSGGLICLAALTKLYFAFALIQLTVWLILHGKWRQWGQLLGGFAVTAALAAWVIWRYTDTYLYNTLLVYFGLSQQAHDTHWAWVQMRIFAGPFSAVLLLLLPWLYWHARRTERKNAGETWLLFFSLAFLVFAFKLGMNLGNYMSYLLQLAGPFLLLAFAALAAEGPLHRQGMTWALALQTTLLLFWVYPSYPNGDLRLARSWNGLESLASSSRRLYAPAAMAWWQVQHGREIQDAGQREYYYSNFPLPPSWNSWFTRSEELKKREDFVQEQEDKDLKTGAYDLVYLLHNDDRHAAMLQRRYRILGEAVLSYSQLKLADVIDVYRLKPQP